MSSKRSCSLAKERFPAASDFGQEMFLSEQHFALAQTAAQIGTWEWDPATGSSKLSPELHQMFGTKPTDPDHVEVWKTRVHPEDMDRMPDLFNGAGRTGVMEFEYRYHHPEKGQCWFYCKGARMQQRGKQMYGIVMDVTERKRAEEARLLLAAIVQSSDDAIVSKDLNGTVTSWNLAAEKMFGYTAQEMIGKPITTIIPPELRSDEGMILGKIRRGEKVDHYETERVTKNGRRVQVSLTVSPVKDKSGTVIGAAKIARDVSERKRTEEALLVSEKLASLGRLAATVAHEINNPLEALVNVVYLIKNNADLPARLRPYASIAEEELNRISALTRQTLGFYRDQRGISATRVGELSRELVAVFSKKAAHKSVNVHLQVQSDPEIQAVKSEIRQLIANLLANSIDAVPANACITIRVSEIAARSSNRRRHGVQLTIGDSGPGIPADIRDKVFEPFFTTKEEFGTGLGLWICKNIVRKHNGKLRLRSSTGKRTNFTVFSVFLPAASSSEKTGRDGDESTSKTAGSGSGFEHGPDSDTNLKAA